MRVCLVEKKVVIGIGKVIVYAYNTCQLLRWLEQLMSGYYESK